MTDRKVYIANAFSIQMLDFDGDNVDYDVKIFPMSIGAVRHIWEDKIDVISAIGHADTAAVVTDILGHYIEAQRINVTLHKGDQLVVAQLIGGRLPEGALHLPDNYRIKFFGVIVK